MLGPKGCASRSVLSQRRPLSGEMMSCSRALHSSKHHMCCRTLSTIICGRLGLLTHRAAWLRHGGAVSHRGVVGTHHDGTTIHPHQTKQHDNMVRLANKRPPRPRASLACTREHTFWFVTSPFCGTAVPQRLFVLRTQDAADHGMCPRRGNPLCHTCRGKPRTALSIAEAE